VFLDLKLLTRKLDILCALSVLLLLFAGSSGIFAIDLLLSLPLAFSLGSLLCIPPLLFSLFCLPPLLRRPLPFGLGSLLRISSPLFRFLSLPPLLFGLLERFLFDRLLPNVLRTGHDLGAVDEIAVAVLIAGIGATKLHVAGHRLRHRH